MIRPILKYCSTVGRSTRRIVDHVTRSDRYNRQSYEGNGRRWEKIGEDRRRRKETKRDGRRQKETIINNSLIS